MLNLLPWRLQKSKHIKVSTIIACIIGLVMSVVFVSEKLSLQKIVCAKKKLVMQLQLKENQDQNLIEAIRKKLIKEDGLENKKCIVAFEEIMQVIARTLPASWYLTTIMLERNQLILEGASVICGKDMLNNYIKQLISVLPYKINTVNVDTFDKKMTYKIVFKLLPRQEHG